jgi:hypothetical protein
MKIYLGPYVYHIGTYQIANKILFWKDVDSDAVKKLVSILEKLGVRKLTDWVNTKQNRKIKIRIDKYDTWGMDHTLALIVLPMLKQLKATKHGSPCVDQKDLPVELRFTKREQLVFDKGYLGEKIKTNDEELDAVHKKFHSQWAWILDQMIWSFENHEDDKEEYHHYYDPYMPGELLEEEPKSYVIKEDGTREETEPLFDENFRRKMGKFNQEKFEAYTERKQRGFVLFGKYFQNLWD